ncbi:MAG TPA: alpha/beta hydrolase [Casimicrobiaceae bacterium]|jgi:pimeloyl-ACP methyl ester carboxylesterase|nr:alpha/beta hydrolase [Casimicrobiaceae bacterium]
MPFLSVSGHRLEYAWYGGAHRNAPPIVMLHEGLGSLSLWRDFPQELADATARRLLVYSRLGHGKSDPLAGPHGVDFMHTEALEILPQLFDSLGVYNPILFGHSEGASMALIHAARAHRPVAAVIALAPHVFVERYGLDSIAAARGAFLDGELRAKLARHHDNVESAFWGWNDIWLHADFVTWNIEALLPEIACPVLAIQGVDDEYGTMEQIDRLERGVRDTRRLELAACGHSPHRDQPDAVLAAVTSFLVEHS